MNKDDMLLNISRLSSAIDFLEGKWARPQSKAEAAILRQLTEILETLQREFEGWQRIHEKPLDPEAAAIAKQYLEEMLSGTTCPVCHQPITEERQVGRCVYGIPCWHRMYQGTAKPKEEKIHPYFQEQLEQEKRERP